MWKFSFFFFTNFQFVKLPVEKKNYPLTPGSRNLQATISNKDFFEDGPIFVLYDVSRKLLKRICHDFISVENDKCNCDLPLFYGKLQNHT